VHKLRNVFRRALPATVVVTLFGVAAYFFLLPATSNLLAGKKDFYLGDGGGDPQTLPFQNNIIIQTFRYRPWLLLFGAVYTPQLQAPYGMGAFITWIERLAVVVSSLVYADAARSIAFEAWLLVVCNGAAFYAFARGMKWHRVLSFALAFAWAFNPYMRARIDAHISLATPFNWPLVFLAMIWVREPERWKRLGASALLVAAFFSPHYYWFSMGFLAPSIVVVFILWRPVDTSRFADVWKLALAGVPVALFVAWNVKVLVPAGLLSKERMAIPSNVDSAIVYALAARPFDFFASDIRFSLHDWLPLRERINMWVALPDRINTAESVNGIRWVILLGAFITGASLVPRRTRRWWRLHERRTLVGIWIFTGSAFLLSMRPDFITLGGVELGPSLLAFKVLSIFRCPCRNGPAVHFGALVLCGVLVHKLVTRSLFSRIPALRFGVLGLFFALVLVDFIPEKGLLMSPLRRGRGELERPGGQCGTGLYAPGAQVWEENSRTQEFYGTSCNIATMPAGLPNDAHSIEEFLRCSGMSWFVWSGSSTTLHSVCMALGWDEVSADSCRAPRTNVARQDVSCSVGAR
jgi:hypothetical protein